MTKLKRPPQIEKLMSRISECLKEGAYRFTIHAFDRHLEKGIDLQDALYVLKNGYHERVKTSFDEAFQSWNYAVRGKTLDQSDLRIIVAFDEEQMLVVTIIDVTRN